MFDHLDDGVVSLRRVTLEDASTYARLQDAEMAARFEWDGPISEAEAASAFERWVEAWKQGTGEHNFAIVLSATGELIGDCAADLRDDGYVNVMYVVFANWRGYGYASQAVRLLVSHARAAFAGHPLILRIHPDNTASVGVARSVGAVRHGHETSREGKRLDRWILDDSSVP